MGRCAGATKDIGDRAGAQTGPVSPIDPPSLREAFWIWLKIGCVGFGGPAGQIALMHRIIVEEKGWVDERRFLHALNFCMLLPGPEAQQLATYLGWLLHRTRGGLIAGTLFVVPGAVVMMLLSIIFVLYRTMPLFDAFLYGVRCAVVAIVAEALLRIGRRALIGPAPIAIAVLSFIAIFFLALPFPLIVLVAGAAGWSAARLAPGPVAASGDAPRLPLPLPAEARPHLAPAAATALILGFAWLAPTLLFAVWLGWNATFTAIGVFFSKLAVVTFGGAYAVLSYVAQQAADVYGWLAPGEMLSGLGLAETTPGPLIMVVQFVAFLGAYRDPGPFEPLAGGIIGGLLATWVTFVPCFLWIFLGAPYVERLRHARALSAALAAITAAVVGVICNLALWFALHVLFAGIEERWIGPVRLYLPDLATLDPIALVISLATLVAMLRLRRGVLSVLAAAAAAGVAARLLI